MLHAASTRKDCPGNRRHQAVDDSLNTNQEIQTILNVTNKAMATSGNYRNFYYKDGKKYAHTIDP